MKCLLCAGSSSETEDSEQYVPEFHQMSSKWQFSWRLFSVCQVSYHLIAYLSR